MEAARAAGGKVHRTADGRLQGILVLNLWHDGSFDILWGRGPLQYLIRFFSEKNYNLTLSLHFFLSCRY
jgi:hypothetical protein